MFAAFPRDGLEHFESRCLRARAESVQTCNDAVPPEHEEKILDMIIFFSIFSGYKSHADSVLWMKDRKTVLALVQTLYRTSTTG